MGFRWLMPITATLLTFVPVWLSQNRSQLAFAAFVVCALVGQYNAFDGLHDPWMPSQWDRWLSGVASADCCRRRRALLSSALMSIVAAQT